MKGNIQKTNGYCIVNYGADEKAEMPCYLVNPMMGRPHYYTTNICRADLYATEWAAKQQMANENEYLKAENHPLAGHLFVAEIHVGPIVEPEED